MPQRRISSPGFFSKHALKAAVATSGGSARFEDWNTNMTEQERMARPLAEVDPEVFEQIRKEAERQNLRLELIASENFTSEAILEAAGSTLTNKYAEGYPGKRYYGGCEFVDQVENIARDRAKRLFGVDHANVQPYSGSPANLAAYLAFLEPGDAVLGMALPDGGHLTHGWGVSVTGRWFRSVRYGVDPANGRLDLDQVRELALRERPKLI